MDSITIIIPAASKAKAVEIFGEGYFIRGMSATGLVPFTHYVTSGIISDDEFNQFCGDPLISYKMFKGEYNETLVRTNTGLQLVNEIPDDYVNDDKPTKITNYAGKMILSQVCPGSRTTLMNFINTIPDVATKEAAMGAWESALFWLRNDQFVQMFIPILGLTEGEVDMLFQRGWNINPVF